MLVNNLHYVYFEYNSEFTVTKLFWDLTKFRVFFNFSGTLPYRYVNHKCFIFASYNFIKFMYYLCSFINLFNFPSCSTILQFFVFMSCTFDDRFEKLFLCLFFWLSCVNICFWDVLRDLKLKTNLWLKSYFWSYLLLSGDMFIYKTSIIQLYCLHYFLSREFRVKYFDERVVNFYFMFLQVSFVKWGKFCRLLFTLRKALIYIAITSNYFPGEE